MASDTSPTVRHEGTCSPIYLVLSMLLIIYTYQAVFKN